MKEIIAGKTGGRLPPERQDIRWSGNEIGYGLKPGKRLADIGVVDGGTLELEIRAPPPTPPPGSAKRLGGGELVPVDASRGGAPTAERSKLKRRRVGSNEKFTGEEAEALVDGVEKFGLSHWSVIRDHYQCFKDKDRNSVDLKDKWRNMCVAAARPPDFKFRVNYFTPELLSKVRTVRAEQERRAAMIKQAEEEELQRKWQERREAAALPAPGDEGEQGNDSE